MQKVMLKSDSKLQKQRLAWSLFDIHDLTGLSVNFLRYEVRRGNLKTRKFGRRVLVLDTDLQNYLEQGSEGKK
ncbi:MAG: hypothetical protein M3209_11020 [Acidobacteriota bacterium]|nr:hypothetical protein [Acidobacteriota bacterium]